MTVPNIRDIRLARRMRFRELAQAVGVPQRVLSAWERGLEEPSSSDYDALSRVLSVDPKELQVGQQQHMRAATPGEGYTTAKPEEPVSITQRQREIPRRKWKVLDLFCGCGGFSYGFEQTGKFAVTAGVDLLTDRVSTFRANHPYASTIAGDIRRLGATQVDEIANKPDVIIGGPPCQGFSSIRPFRTLTEEDDRNSLPEQFVLLVSSIRPKWFVFENVVGLLAHEKGRAFRSLLDAFEAAGYLADWRVINMAMYGLPQTRERVVIVGSADGVRFEWPTPTHTNEHRSMAGRRAKRIHLEPLFNGKLAPAVTVSEAICDLPPVGSGQAAYSYLSGIESEYTRAMRGDETEVSLHEATRHSEKMLAIIRQAGSSRAALPEGLTSSGFSSCYSRLDGDKPSVTLTVNFVHPSSNRCIHPTQDRALTPREGARLQSFPDCFEFIGTRAQIVKQIGNAVPPLLGRVLADSIAKALTQDLEEQVA